MFKQLKSSLKSSRSKNAPTLEVIDRVDVIKSEIKEIRTNDSLNIIPSVKSIQAHNKRSEASQKFLIEQIENSSNRSYIEKLPEFDLSRIVALELNESLFRISCTKTKERLMNAGFEFKSKNLSSAKYVKRRLEEICDLSGKPLNILIDEILSQLITTSNCFIYKNRDGEASSGRPVKIQGTSRYVEPTASLEVLDTTRIRPLVNKSYSKVHKWRLYNSDFTYGERSLSSYLFQTFTDHSRTLTIDNKDMVHMYLNKQPGFIFGCPFVMSAIPDIKELRMLEELIMIVAYQRAYPLIHCQVGRSDIPGMGAQVSENGVEIEVERVARNFESLVLEGIVTTSDRIKFETVLDGYDVDKMMPLLHHYITRVENGVCLTKMEKGDNSGTSRASAYELGKEGITRSSYYGFRFQDFFNHFIINDILREGGIDPSDEEKKVTIEFNVLDQESKNANQTHALALFQGNAITHEEMRSALGKYPITPEEEKRLILEMVTLKQADFVEKVKAQTKESQAQQRGSGSNQHGGRKISRPVAK